jgi:hypothetical protein
MSMLTAREVPNGVGGVSKSYTSLRGNDSRVAEVGGSGNKAWKRGVKGAGGEHT